MKTVLFAAACLVVLGGCSLTPDATAPSWTDARLQDAPPGAAPAYIERAVLSPSERAALEAGLDETLAARDRVRGTGAPLRAPTRDTAEFVVEARSRALPPPLD